MQDENLVDNKYHVFEPVPYRRPGLGRHAATCQVVLADDPNKVLFQVIGRSDEGARRAAFAVARLLEAEAPNYRPDGMA